MEDGRIDLGTTISVTIRAPIEEVWNALTTPEQIKRWFFGVDTETDWQVGSPLVHRGEWQGKRYEDKSDPPVRAADAPRAQPLEPGLGPGGSSGALPGGQLVAHRS